MRVVMGGSRSRKRIKRVKARLFQVFKNVIQCRQADSHFFRDIGPGCLFTITSSKAVLQLHELPELRYTFSRFRYFASRITTCRKHLKQRASGGIALRVNKGVVQWFDTISYFEKAGCLHKCCGAETRYLMQFCT